MNVAFFDVDGTLVAGTSTERLFFRWLARRRLLGVTQWFSFLTFLIRHLPRFGRDVAKKNKAYLTGLDVDQVAAEAAAFVDAVVMARLNPACVARLDQHRRDGDRVVLLTGTLEAIADALAARLAVDAVIATECVVRSDHYTADVPVTHPFGAAKRELIDRYLDDNGAGVATVVAYGDSIHDQQALERANAAVCVSPDSELRRLAGLRGWQILESGR